MAALLRKMWQGYNIVFDELPDPRTKSWFLIAKPYQVCALLGLYHMFVLKWGPQWMRNRPAFNVDKIMIIYNFIQVLANLYIFVKSIQLAWGWRYQWFCEPIDWSVTPLNMEICATVYYYFATKVVDLLDTIFFVLRKKQRQVSFLHVYHHTGMVILIWGAATFLPGGHGTLVGVINSFVHVVMYSYYLYTVAVPSAKNSVWWKKYITQLQIVQFFWCVVHMGAPVFIPDCGYPRWTSAVFLPQNLFILVLFIDFYIKTYFTKPAEKPKPKEHLNSLKKEHVHINGKSNGYSKENGLDNSSLRKRLLLDRIPK